MKRSLAALLFITLLGGHAAHAKCVSLQCSSVVMKVASCKAAALNADGKVFFPSTPPGHDPSGVVRGQELMGHGVKQHQTACYVGLSAASREPDSSGSEFFVHGQEPACAQVVGKTIGGETEHPCCDTPVDPGEVHLGTCHPQVRLLKSLKVLPKSSAALGNRT